MGTFLNGHKWQKQNENEVAPIVFLSCCLFSQ